jgi:hypothetical protein
VGGTPYGASGAGGFGIAIDDQGNIGTYFYGGGGVTGELGPTGLPNFSAGGEASGGLQMAWSNAQTISDLAGPFGNASIGGGDGIGGSIDGFTGNSSNGWVTGGGFTLGLGDGIGGFAGVTNTWVNPFNPFAPSGPGNGGGSEGSGAGCSMAAKKC